MGIPDRTVDHAANYDVDVYETIINESNRLNMSEMDVWCAWRIGLAALTEMRKLDVELPHDPSKSDPEKSIFVRTYLWRDNGGFLHIAMIENTGKYRKPEDIEQDHDFVRWVDHDWREIKA